PAVSMEFQDACVEIVAVLSGVEEFMDRRVIACREKPEACEGKHDQGALNYVCGSSLILVSNRWNFPKQFIHLVNISSLSIVHYMAHPKPWHGTF
ncbi:hypothetical protein ACC847_37310, partial [Rhizobium johnstonii]